MEVLRNSRGAVLVYTTLFLLILGLLFIALGIDVGWLADVRSQGQAATDAAALRGAAAIPNYNTTGNTTQVYNMATGLNSANTVMNQGAGISGSDLEFCTGTPAAPTCSSATTPAIGVRVTKTYSSPLFFSRVLNGGSNADISVSSTAWLGGPGGLQPTLPVTLCANEIGFPGQCNPTLSAEFSPNNTDNAGWWSKDTSANSNICRSMVNGSTPIPFLNISEPINLNNGEITSCHKEIEDKYKTCTADSCSGVEGQAKKDFCTTILPVVNCPPSVNQQQPVIGFAAICITQVKSTPAESATITGNLNCNVVAPNSIGGGISFGVSAGRPVLVK